MNQVNASSVLAHMGVVWLVYTGSRAKHVPAHSRTKHTALPTVEVSSQKVWKYLAKNESLLYFTTNLWNCKLWPNHT